MCRIAARAGTPAPLSRVLYDLPRSLHELAYAPREQTSGTVNVDGTGVAWFDDDDPAPLCYRSELPPWSDPNLPGLAPRLRSHLVLAAVRSTTPGMPQGAAFVHPFTAGGLAGTHNGWIGDFAARVARPLVAELSDEAFAQLTGLSDAYVLFLLAADAHASGASAPEAARHATDVAAKVCEAVGATATLTLVVADARGIAAVNAAVGRPANSLYVRDDGAERLLSSEPADDRDGWQPVPPGGAAELTTDHLEIHAP